MVLVGPSWLLRGNEADRRAVSPTLTRFVPTSAPVNTSIPMTVLGTNFLPSETFYCSFGDIVSPAFPQRRSLTRCRSSMRLMSTPVSCIVRSLHARSHSLTTSSCWGPPWRSSVMDTSIGTFSPLLTLSLLLKVPLLEESMSRCQGADSFTLQR
jgi:hypothetical protein